MKKIRAAIVGYGNIGKYVLEALQAAPDFEIAGIVRRDANNVPDELREYPVVEGIENLQDVAVAILCTPTRKVEDFAIKALSLGINTVDSIVRALMEACAPKGITYTNFGPGMSMGHTVAVKAVEGVKAALSMTIPLGTGIHRRMVYIELKDGYKFEEVAKAIKNDAYFIEDVNALLDMGHGVHMTRKGVSGTTQNQLFEFNMKINNPALTAQNLVGVARASLLQQPGCYTMIEIPVIDMLYGDRETLIKHLV